MKNIIPVLFLLLFSSNSVGQDLDLNIGHTLEKEYYSQIPFEHIRDKIIIPVTIEDKTYRFLFDTGAPTSISTNLHKEISTTLLSEVPIKDVNQTKKNIKIVALPSLKIGTVSFLETATLVLDINSGEAFKCFGIDGIIGSNMLRNSIIQLKLENKTLTITNNKKELDLKRRNSIKMKLLGKQSTPFVTVRHKGKDKGKEQVMIDLGATGFFSLSQRVYEVFREEEIFTELARSHGATSIGIFGLAEHQEQVRLLIPEIKVGNSRFHNYVTVTNPASNSRLGGAILDYGEVTIDYRNKRFYFNTAKKAIDLQENLLGLSLTIIDDKLIIGFIWDKDLLDRISVGDEILSINGNDISDMNKCRFFIGNTDFHKNKILALVVKTSQGELIDLTIERELPEQGSVKGKV